LAHVSDPPTWALQKSCSSTLRGQIHTSLALRVNLEFLLIFLRFSCLFPGESDLLCQQMTT